VNPLDVFFGPLATVECRRAVRPPWLAWVRMLAGMPAAGIVLVVLWLWMLWGKLDPAFLPGDLLAFGLLTLEGTQIVLALLMSPALIAGSIAGEKDRGTLTMLLASRLSASNIVLGRLIGCFSQVLLLSAAGLPAIVLLAAVRRAGLSEMLLLAGLPAAIALGAAGLTVAASTLARRGRDALLTVYVVEVLLILAAYFGGDSRRPGLVWLATLNPFAVLYPLVRFGATWPAAMAAAFWFVLGSAGTAVAIWQLWPAYHRQTGGATRDRRARRRRVPPLLERPMLWKELHIETAGTLGAVGRWSFRLLVALLFGGGLVTFAALAWQRAHGGAAAAPVYEAIGDAIARSATLVLWLVQWAIGLRASGVVSGERQRSTWDAILASPLEGREIILAKIWGSLYALRFLVVAACIAWTAAVFAGGMTVSNYFSDLALLVAGGAFMATAGVAVSMGVANATRGMAVTIGLWMAAAVATAVLAWLLSIVAMLLGMVVVATFVLVTSPSQISAVGPNSMGWILSAIYVAARVGLYLAAATAIVLWLAARFDTLAGRMGDVDIGAMARKSLNSLTGSSPDAAAPP